MMYIKPKKKVAEEVAIPKELTEMPFVDDGKPYRLSLKAKFSLVFIFGLATILALTFLGLRGIFALQKWSENYYLAGHPVLEYAKTNGYKSTTFAYTINKPLTIEKREKAISYIPVISGSSGPLDIITGTVLTSEEKERVVANSGLSKIVRGVWILETNKGANPTNSAHHNECAKVGMTNEFGYGALDDYCFESFEDSVARVTEWFEGELKTKTLTSALCYYNSGKATSTCSYAVSFAKLDQDGKLASK